MLDGHPCQVPTVVLVGRDEDGLGRERDGVGDEASSGAQPGPGQVGEVACQAAADEDGVGVGQGEALIVERA